MSSLGVSPLAPAAMLLGAALQAVLPARHPFVGLLLAGGSVVGALSAEQTWAQIAWGVLAAACCFALLATAQRARRALQSEPRR